MNAIQILQQQSELAHHSMMEAVEGIDEPTSWGLLNAAGHENEYLHTDGSIHGIALHVASCKIMYGSIAFRNTDVRWRDCADHIQKIEPDWISAVQYLEEVHEYWMDSWSHLTDADLDSHAMHFSGQTWPVWKIIQTVIHHDGYHAGQIAMLRYSVHPTQTYPPSAAEDIRTHCSSLASW